MFSCVKFETSLSAEGLIQWCRNDGVLTGDPRHGIRECGSFNRAGHEARASGVRYDYVIAGYRTAHERPIEMLAHVTQEKERGSQKFKRCPIYLPEG